MNKEEIIKRALYILHTTGYTNELDKSLCINAINQLQQENKQLKDNWNKLKEYIKADGVSYLNLADERCFCNKKEAKYILSKMQELEKRSKNE